MKTNLKILLVFAILLTGAELSAQRPFVETSDEFAELATKNLDELVQDEKFLKGMEKEEIHGSYTYQITVGDKGKITHMRSLERSEDASIHGQNTLNDLVRHHKFDFKIPKGNLYNFQYTFIIP
ncbi:hypothetical protein O3Q51_14745 [Cryomorphaceae bacterium 1068]|nr:hypothetical protein [Cryomorphaceae bacterium 1068]